MTFSSSSWRFFFFFVSCPTLAFFFSSSSCPLVFPLPFPLPLPLSGNRILFMHIPCGVLFPPCCMSFLVCACQEVNFLRLLPIGGQGEGYVGGAVPPRDVRNGCWDCCESPGDRSMAWLRGGCCARKLAGSSFVHFHARTDAIISECFSPLLQGHMAIPQLTGADFPLAGESICPTCTGGREKTRQLNPCFHDGGRGASFCHRLVERLWCQTMTGA